MDEALSDNLEIPTGWVYIIKSQGCYKIGRTKNIKSRIKSYKTENPYQITILAQKEVVFPKSVEHILLNRFKQKNLHGEWFNLNTKELIILMKLLKGYEI